MFTLTISWWSMEYINKNGCKWNTWEEIPAIELTFRCFICFANLMTSIVASTLICVALLSGSLKRTVAALWMTTSTFSINSWRSSLEIPRLGSVQSPAMGLINFSGFDRLVCNFSKSFNLTKRKCIYERLKYLFIFY